MNMEKKEYVEVLKNNTYYDKDGTQILVGDLLKVEHFKVGKRVHYMYHVVVMEETQDFPVMAIKAHYADLPHCRMYSCTNKQTRVYETAKIIGEKDWQTKRQKIKI